MKCSHQIESMVNVDSGFATTFKSNMFYFPLPAACA